MDNGQSFVFWLNKRKGTKFYKGNLFMSDMSESVPKGLKDFQKQSEQIYQRIARCRFNALKKN